jgi:hypothetical protein
VFALLGWEVLNPESSGTPSRTVIQAIQALDPDLVIFQNAGMRKVVADSPQWRALNVTCPYAAAEAKHRGIGAGNEVVDVAEADRREDRAEDLFLGNPHVVLQPTIGTRRYIHWNILIRRQ